MAAVALTITEQHEDAVREDIANQVLLIERMKYRRIDFLFPETGPLRRQLYVETMDWFEASNSFQETALFGGNRCKAPDSIIDTADGQALIREVADGSGVDVLSWDGENQCIAQAAGWFLKGFEPMFRVLLDNGDSFACTAQHRLLGRDGRFYALSELLGRTCGVYYSDKASSYLASCVTDDCRYGEGLPSGLCTDLKPHPLQDGAQKRRPAVSHEDVMGRISPHIQYCLACGPHTNHGDLRQLSGLFDQFSSAMLSHASQALLKRHRELQRPYVAAVSQLLLNTSAFCHQSSLRGLGAGPGYSESAYNAELGQCEDQGFELSFSGCSLDELNRQFVRDTEHISIFLAYANTTLFGGNSIVAVLPVGYQPVLDCTVDKTHCYSAGGVMHRNTGKTESGAFAVTCHATGEYPDWWKGRRFSGATSGVVAGKDGKTVRDSVQIKLLGFPEREFGTGLIPRDRLVKEKCKKASRPPNLYETLVIKNVSGEESIINLKSYDSGRTAFEATKRHYVWEDEEAPKDIHGENLARVFDYKGLVFNTYTPMKGQTELTRDLRRRSQQEDPTVYMATLTWDNVPHITADMIEAYKGRWPDHEMKARRWGQPKMGSGSIFTTDFDEVLKIRSFRIPLHWPRAFGLDFGWAPHPTAAVWGAWDRESDIIYLYSEHRMKMELPSVHVDAIKMRGSWIKGNSETAGTNASDGKRMIDIYRGMGLHLIKAKKDTEANIFEMRQRVETGRLKVFDTLIMWREEYESFHRNEGKIDKIFDDLMDATLYMLSRMTTFGTKPTKRTRGRITEPKFGDYTI